MFSKKMSYSNWCHLPGALLFIFLSISDFLPKLEVVVCIDAMSALGIGSQEDLKFKSWAAEMFLLVEVRLSLEEH